MGARAVFGQIRLDDDAVVTRLRVDQADRVADQIVDVHPRAPGRLFADEALQPAHDLAGAHRLSGDFFQGFRQIARGLAALQAQQTPLSVTGNRPQRLVDLVRQPGGHLAHGTDPQHVCQLRRASARLLLDSLAFGDVAAVDDDRVHPRDVDEIGADAFHPAPRPVLVAIAELHRAGTAAAHQIFERALGGLAVVGVDQLESAAAAQLLRIVSEDTQNRRTEIAQGAVRIDQHDDVRAVLDEGAEARLALAQPRFGLLALGDVEGGAEHGDLAAELDGAARVLDPPLFALFGDDLDLVARRDGLAAQPGQAAGADEVAEVGMNHIPERHGEHLVARIAGHRRGGPVDVAQRPPLKDERRRRHRVGEGAEARLVLAQRLVGWLVRRAVVDPAHHAVYPSSQRCCGCEGQVPPGGTQPIRKRTERSARAITGAQ